MVGFNLDFCVVVFKSRIIEYPIDLVNQESTESGTALPLATVNTTILIEVKTSMFKSN